MYKVDYPEDKVYRRNECEDSDYKSGGVLGLEVANYTVDAANERAKEDLKDDSDDLIDRIVLGSVGIIS